MCEQKLYQLYGIYGIKNLINNKVYVGKTINNFGDRRDCHYAALNGNYHHNQHLQRAWNKYGIENFEFFIIFNCINNENLQQVNDLEKKYIKEYREQNLCYNLTDGGDGGLGLELSPEVRQKIGEKNRQRLLGKKLSAETRYKMSEAQNKRYANWTQEDRQKFGEIVSQKSRGYKWSQASKENFAKKQQTQPNGAKYDIVTVHIIRDLYENLHLSTKKISEILNISQHTVYQIATYRRWKNV